MIPQRKVVLLCPASFASILVTYYIYVCVYIIMYMYMIVATVLSLLMNWLVEIIIFLTDCINNMFIYTDILYVCIHDFSSISLFVMFFSSLTSALLERSRSGTLVKSEHKDDVFKLCKSGIWSLTKTTKILVKKRKNNVNLKVGI